MPKKRSEGKKTTKGKGAKAKKPEKKEEEKKGGPESIVSELGLFTDDCVFSNILRLSYDEFKDAPQDLINNFLNPDTITHMIRAGLEGYEVMRTSALIRRYPMRHECTYTAGSASFYLR